MTYPKISASNIRREVVAYFEPVYFSGTGDAQTALHLQLITWLRCPDADIASKVINSTATEPCRIVSASGPPIMLYKEADRLALAPYLKNWVTIARICSDSID